MYLQYLDTNNRHGCVMIQKLPTHGFTWEKVDDFTSKKIDKCVKTVKKGYNLEADVEYPDKLHKSHNGLPFLAENEA